MAEDTVITIIVVTITAIAGIIGSIVSPIIQKKKDLEGKFELNLYEKRITAYTKLIKNMRPLTFHEDLPNISLLQKAYSDNTTWYYEEGIFLTQDCMDTFRKFQEKLREIVEREYVTGDPDEEKLYNTHVQSIKEFASSFRSQLIKDLDSRRNLKMAAKK